MSKPILEPVRISSNEFSLGNLVDVSIVIDGRTVLIPLGSTLYFEDAGSYDFHVIESDDVSSSYCLVEASSRFPNDGQSLNRVVFNKSVEIDGARAMKLRDADQTAEIVRAAYITPGSGQAMVYIQKREEARSYLENNAIDLQLIPHIVAEAAITGLTHEAQAQMYLTMASQWAIKSAQIESVRLAYKKLVNAAQSVAELAAIQPIDWSQVTGNAN